MNKKATHLTPEFSFNDVKYNKLILLSADKTASIDVSASGELEFLEFAQALLKECLPPRSRNRDLFANFHTHDMDVNGRFYIVSQFALLKETKDLVQRKGESK